MAALAGPVHVLDERALVTLDQVPGPPRDDQPRARRERERARRRRQRGERQTVQRHARHGPLARRREQVDLHAVRDERPDQPGGRALDAAVEHERARDEQEPHGRASRSSSGYSTARAARKL